MLFEKIFWNKLNGIVDFNIVFIVDFYNAFELSNGLWLKSSSVSSTKMRTVKNY